MSEIFEKLGIDAKLLIAQIVNFVLLLIILQYVAYKPILKMLKERTEKIDKSLKQALKIQEELKNTEETKFSEIKKAKEEAQKIVKEAHEAAEKKSLEAIEKTKEKTKEIVEKAKLEIKAEKDNTIREAKKEIVQLSIEIAKKVIGDSIDEENEKKSINETLSKIK